ncbi:hypothetical protein [Micromonospora sp. NPDC048839]|uniref:hypothetical protein n=1 Tax=Micromonospora sp. NPDC048839 TaxID=3155641 RepID=UPI0033C4F245
MSQIQGNTSAVHLSAAEQDKAYREERQAKARKFLLDRDLADVAEILGLVESAPPVRRTVRGEVR